jgi:DNA-binding NtrC family response regulator
MIKTSEPLRILISDDNRELTEVLMEYLRVEGDAVDGATNGRDALEMHRKCPYDLIITDLKMPEISGIDLIKTIKKDSDVTEFVIITGYASLDTAMEAVKIGAFDYIVKPFRMDELKVVVKNAKDKIGLKKLNTELLGKLKSFYDEIERYKQKIGFQSNTGNGNGPHGTAQKILRETNDLERLTKGKLYID